MWTDAELSHVGMGYQVCPICLTQHDEVVLLDKRLKKSLPRESSTGWSLCPEHKAMRDEYIALVEVEGQPASGTPLHEVKRTGQTCHVRRSAAKEIFNIPLPDTLNFTWVEIGVITELQEKMNEN